MSCEFRLNQFFFYYLHIKLCLMMMVFKFKENKVFKLKDFSTTSLTRKKSKNSLYSYYLN